MDYSVFAQSNPGTDYPVKDAAMRAQLSLDSDKVDSGGPGHSFGYCRNTTAALNFGYYGGCIWNGGALTVIAAGTVALANNVTNYVEMTRAGGVSANAVGFTAGRIRLYTVVTAGGAITAITDKRARLLAGGEIDDMPIGQSVQAPIGATTLTTSDLASFSAAGVYQLKWQRTAISRIWGIAADVNGMSLSNVTDAITPINISNAGNVTINDPNAARHTIGASTASVAIELRNNNNAATASVAETNAVAAQANTWHFVDGFSSISGAAVRQYAIYGDGSFGSRPNVYGAISDRKLKKDEELAGSQWEDVKALARIVKKFRLIDDPDQVLMLGWIAQDVELISPGLVGETPDTEWYDAERTWGEQIDTGLIGDDGKPIIRIEPRSETYRERRPSGTTTKSVKHSIAHLKALKALGEALERIEALETTVALLKGV